MRQPDVIAAGVVVFRPRRQVLLVHRPKYDDWSFPKGKLDPGEHAVAAAVREVEEETGLRVRLCVPLPDQHYPVAAGDKAVHYWVGRCTGTDDVAGYAPNAEIDEVAWVPLDEARRRLTYERDRATLAHAVDARKPTRPVVVLRHGRAEDRERWTGDDRMRPLDAEGRRQAERAVPLLGAYDVRRLVSSTSTRCTQSLEPYAEAVGRPVETYRGLTEEEATPASVADIVGAALEDGVATALCGHRPVLPMMCAVLGVEEPHLEVGEMLVLHLRGDKVCGVERHRV